MSEVFRWGILGCGRIADAFATGLQALDGHRVAAVGSRDLARAQAFAARFPSESGPAAHGSYEGLCADALDAIYVATPHSHHAEHARLVLDAGKALLLEKPFTVNARETEEVLTHAADREVFAMEAMWTRFRPALLHVLDILESRDFGKPQMLHASFGFRGDFDPDKRHFRRELAGGALLDVGVYCVSLAMLVFGGRAQSRASLASIGTTGVDERSGYLLGFDGGGLAVLSSAIGTDTQHDAVVDMENGRIVIPDFWRPTRVLVNGDERCFEEPGNGYQWQALEVERCVRSGLLESPLRTHAETVDVMRELDALRSTWDLRYPADDARNGDDGAGGIKA